MRNWVRFLCVNTQSRHRQRRNCRFFISWFFTDVFFYFFDSVNTFENTPGHSIQLFKTGDFDFTTLCSAYEKKKKKGIQAHGYFREHVGTASRGTVVNNSRYLYGIFEMNINLRCYYTGNSFGKQYLLHVWNNARRHFTVHGAKSLHGVNCPAKRISCRKIIVLSSGRRWRVRIYFNRRRRFFAIRRRWRRFRVKLTFGEGVGGLVSNWFFHRILRETV